MFQMNVNANCSTITKMKEQSDDACIARMHTYCRDGLFWRAEGISEMIGRVQSSYHATDNESKDEMTDTKADL